MKTVSKLFIILLISGMAFTSCKKKAEKIIESGKWTVSKYFEDAKDETSDFNGYIFEFKSDGTFNVTVGSTTTTGTWTYDDNATKYHYAIAGTGALDKINGGWLILTKSSTQLELQDDNATKNELLTFTKL